MNSVKVPSLRFVAFRLTNSCDLKCKHCYVSAGKRLENELNTSEIVRVIEELAAFNLLCLTFTGGEPLIRKDSFEIINHADEFGIPIEIFTNGTLINDSTFEKIKKLKNLVAISMSLDGARPDSHDYVHGKGNFHVVTSLFKRFAQANIRTQANISVSKVNFTEYKKIIELALELGVSLVGVSHVILLGRAKINEKELGLAPEEVAEVAYNVFRMKNKKVIFDIPNCKTCGIRCMICPNGDVTSCIPLWAKGITAGNIREKSLSEIWSDSQLFKELRAISVDNIDGCSTCDHKYGCWGGCRATIESKNWLTQRDPFECSWRKIYFKRILGQDQIILRFQ